MTNAEREKVWEIESRPFGDVPTIIGSAVLNLRFPGQYFDVETGLHQNRHRDYMSSLGRYLEADPIGVRRGKNHLFVYVQNNPIKLIDPYGLSAIPAKLYGDVISEIVSPDFTSTIGSLTGAMCASKTCRSKIGSVNFMNAYGKCISIFSDHKLPTGVNVSDEFVSSCAEECVNIVKSKKYSEHCFKCE